MAQLVLWGLGVGVPITIAFLVVLISISLLAAHIGGWARLAKRYPDNGDTHGKAHYMSSAFFGGCSYNGLLVFRACNYGLRMSILFPLFGHPPLYIPWNQFHSVSECRVCFRRLLSASVGQPTVATMRLPVWIREHLEIEL